MKLLLLLCCLVSLAACLIVREDVKQYAVVYKGINCTGESFNTTNNVKDLNKYNFDKTIESVNLVGMWIFYEDKDYKGISYWMIGYKNCSTDSTLSHYYQNYFSSMRYVGDSENFNTDTCTIYDGDTFTGNQFETDIDIPEVGNYEASRSLIITGTSSWTLYPQENYGGLGMCFLSNKTYPLPENQSITLGMYRSSTFPVRSIKKGCYENDDRLGVNSETRAWSPWCSPTHVRHPGNIHSRPQAHLALPHQPSPVDPRCPPPTRFWPSHH